MTREEFKRRCAVLQGMVSETSIRGRLLLKKLRSDGDTDSIREEMDSLEEEMISHLKKLERLSNIPLAVEYN